VTRIGLIGAGVMGAGISQTLATAGCDVVCSDLGPEALERARETVTTGRYGFHRAVERGKLTQDVADAALARLTFTTNLEEAVSTADVVVEAVFEDLALKIGVFQDLDQIAPASAILASNTSGFPIVALAGATRRPDRVVGWHWASPPPVMRMAEIVRHPGTSDATVDTVCALASSCGKNPVVIKDQPMTWGFVSNRLYGAMLREAARVVDEGVATPEQINQIMVDCFNWPVGPYGMVAGARGGWKPSG
jgi:3-hydroxyacyl-CoA dehydrogenase